MNSKKLRYVPIAMMTLLLFVGGCTENNNKVGAKNPENKSEKGVEKGKKAEARSSTLEQSTNFDPVKSSKFTDAAKFLAGMKVEEKSAIAPIQDTQAWKDHATSFEEAWAKLDQQQLSKISTWADAELKSINQSGAPIFYPFSGPDFLYAYHFFPKGNEYVMAGLEPVGTIPDIEKIPAEEMDRKLQGIHKSLNAILQLSFFRTNDMKVDLAEKGVLPILFVFMARTNNKILDVQYVGLNNDGKIEVLDEAQKDSKPISGVKISFVPEGESQTRSLYYFSCDLSNEGLEKTPEFNKFVQQLSKPITYLKAASYLMHYDYFSKIRDLILAQSSSVLQDDSGMPVKYLDDAKWDVKYYGSYIEPIDLFKNMYQADLKKKYQDDGSIKQLDFGIGYKFKVTESNLMLAIAKDKSPSEPKQ